MVKYVQTIALMLMLGLVQAQETLYTEPVEFWTSQILPDVDTNSRGVFKGNGCKLTPDNRSLVVTSVGGTVTSFEAGDGTFEWDYNPPQPDDGVVRSHSQVVFTTPNAETPPYMVYSIVENENSQEALTRVIALDMDGNELWVSDPLDGVAAGSPVVSDDGGYIFLTHNANFETIGYFTALSAPEDGAVFYSRSNETTPFAPLGIYHSPIEGNYDGSEGRGNTNDMIMWSMTPKPTDDPIQPGHTFGFQFPVGFDGNASDVGYFLLGDTPRTFQAITAPVLHNSGLYAYFSTSRSGFWAWNGFEDDGRGRFNRGPQGIAGFERNDDFAGQSVFASPALSSSPDAPFVFGGTAATQFVRLDFQVTEEEAIILPTTDLIKAEARVDPFDRVVYFVEESGLLHQVTFANIEDQWTLDLGFPVEGEMALSEDGYILYVADTSGSITALQLSDIAVTPSPSATPTETPSASPTSPTPAPVMVTPSPSASPSFAPTVAPFVAPTPEPSAAPTDAPVFASDTPAPTGDSPTASASQPMFVLSLASLLLAMLF